MYGKELFPQIKADSRADRYSQNLMKWVRKHRNKPLFIGFATEGKHLYDPAKTQSGLLYVGFGHEGHGLDDGYLMGARLSDILCNGLKAGEFAFAPRMKFVEVPGWWQRYIEGGKCCIDPEHWLYADRERWDVAADGKSRRCLWCGNYHEYLHSEMVEKTSWRRVPKA